MNFRGRAAILGNTASNVVFAALTQSTGNDETEGTLVLKIETFSGVHTTEAYQLFNSENGIHNGANHLLLIGTELILVGTQIMASQSNHMGFILGLDTSSTLNAISR